MSKTLAYTEMTRAQVLPGLTKLINRTVGRGTVIGVSIDMLDAPSGDTIATVLLAFSSPTNPSGAPLGTLVRGMISQSNGIRWDGRAFMAPDMQLTLVVNCTENCVVTASILVENDTEINKVPGDNRNA